MYSVSIWPLDAIPRQIISYKGEAQNRKNEKEKEVDSVPTMH